MQIGINPATGNMPIRSKVGVGDSTAAGIVLSLARGKPLAEAALFGVAAGAAAVMTPGTELCRREDVERLYRQMIETGSKNIHSLLRGILCHKESGHACP